MLRAPRDIFFDAFLRTAEISASTSFQVDASIRVPSVSTSQDVQSSKFRTTVSSPTRLQMITDAVGERSRSEKNQNASMPLKSSTCTKSSLTWKVCSHSSSSSLAQAR